MPAKSPENSGSPTLRSAPSQARSHVSPIVNGSRGFVLPMVHITVPESAVTVGFWGALVGAAALGVVDLPVAALIGASVVMARRHLSH